MKLSITHKLAIGFGIVVILLAIVSGISIYSLYRFQNLTEELIYLQEVNQLTNQGKEALLNEREAIRQYVLNGDSSGLEKMQQAQESFGEWESTIKDMPGEIPSGLREILSVREKHKEMLGDAIYVYLNFPENTSEIRRELGEANGFAENNLDPLIDQFYDKELDKLQKKADTVERNTDVMIYVAIGLGGASILIAVVSAFFISRGIIRSASHLSEAADAISRGDLDVPIEVNTGDEMEELAESIERMRTSLKAAIERLRR